MLVTETSKAARKGRPEYRGTMVLRGYKMLLGEEGEQLMRENEGPGKVRFVKRER